MNQQQKDAIVMKQIFEKVLSVLYDNNVMYTRENIHRIAQIFMALSVNMIGMSSNDLGDFRKKAQKLVDKMDSMMDNMDPMQRGKLFKAIDDQISWFDSEYKRQKEEFDDETESEMTVEKSDKDTSSLN